MSPTLPGVVSLFKATQSEFLVNVEGDRMRGKVPQLPLNGAEIDWANATLSASDDSF